ncbi:hypothetical protein [Catenulispora subtropica]|uniref:hypothetical protein n=1 Tax=Catenulispora subtropica TaxID=450798 RepID=UPI0031D41129
MSTVPPEASALAFVRYHLPLSSLELADELRESAGVLVAPGIHFGVENHLRIAHGLQPHYLDAALAGITKVLVAA